MREKTPTVDAAKQRSSECTTRASSIQKAQKSDNPNFIGLEVIRYAMSARRKAHREKLRDEIVEICAIGTHMMTDLREWRRLVEADWGELKPPKEKDQEHALRHAFRWTFGTAGASEKQASFYYNAVGPLAEKGLAGAALRDVIKTRGLKKLQAEHSARKKGGAAHNLAVKAPPEDHAPKAARLASAKTTETVAAAPRAASSGEYIVQAELHFKAEPKELLSAKNGSNVTLKAEMSLRGKMIVFNDARAKLRNKNKATSRP
ncbi:hypothetical protein [Neorhizobium galegae]|uniref:Uncharacterized protein n=1 Tax=Neorhizobium galegae bv. officinalis TaxID=323656 RepID=A0A0T7GAC9_NEOGA|nr:hypothetical protein [Neorhizobium galegae]CDZ44275.1 Hypothetical protein NGAL_HAMBI1189_02700 [Neorhizobium galegae bv. officinalis]